MPAPKRKVADGFTVDHKIPPTNDARKVPIAVSV